VIAERLIGPKTNEVPEFHPLLRDLDIAGCVVTVDAGHTVRAHARFLVEDKMVHYVMIVKRNQKTLFDRIDALDWAGVPIGHHTVDTGHARRERRTIRMMDAPTDLGFPYAAQVFLIERCATRTVRRRSKGNRKYRRTLQDGDITPRSLAWLSGFRSPARLGVRLGSVQFSSVQTVARGAAASFFR
jgi:predicted transposase YbfD/YdcC